MVFIIKRRFSYSEIDYETSLISDPLRKATINLLSEEYRTKYGYYQGLMYQDNRNYFSFVPFYFFANKVSPEIAFWPTLTKGS